MPSNLRSHQFEIYECVKRPAIIMRGNAITISSERNRTIRLTNRDCFASIPRKSSMVDSKRQLVIGSRQRRRNRRRKVFVSVPLSRFSCGKIVFCLRSLPQFKLNGRQIRLTQIDSPVRLTVSWQGLIKEKKAWPERHKKRPFEFKVFKQEFWHVLRSKNYGNRGKLHVLLFSELQSDVEVGAHLNSPTIKFRSH